MKATELKQQFETNAYDALLEDLYEDAALVEEQKKRYAEALGKFVELYGDQDVEIYSAPGRTEVGGNHTDHQHGCILAASINLDAIAVVAKQNDVVKMVSDGFDMHEIDVNDLTKKYDEIGTSEAMIRGVMAKLASEGHKVGGFCAYATSEVPLGAGLSSSASFQVLIGSIINGLYNEMKIDMVDIAKAGQYAENVYFGKPCGLMDQCACAVGGLVNIDFYNPKSPVVNKVNVDFSQFDHSLCIVDTNGTHEDLTDDYAAVLNEMKSVANYFGKDVLREVGPAVFFVKLPEVREKVGDRAVLRAFHFFEENERVDILVNSLKQLNFNEFKSNIQRSGNSSFKYLQNSYSISDVNNQSISVALAMSDLYLGTHGVSRVHGGGFAGTIQAFVENQHVAYYKEKMEAIFGEGNCHVLKIRKSGGRKVIG